ncbi:MAG: hypothetical protein KDK23_13965, partial [Leptospiraceae bacterium]|nr:hypothetical protein [Leptospiraceae bacterium]
ENEKLRISDFHKEAFIPITKSVYDYSELASFYESMRIASDNYCQFVHRRKPFNKGTAEQLIAPEHLTKFWGDRFWGSFHNLLSGCWNFYIMNDVRPFDDFKLIHGLFPDANKHCYSVGLMQPYIMHNTLKCEDLNFLDVDWRIHYAHFQLEQMFRDARFPDAKEAEKAIEDLHLGWIAFSPTPVSPRHAVSPATLCRLNQRECLEHLARYQSNRSTLKAITWNLSALHDARFEAHRGMPVIYLSNAIEELYTSKQQFDQLLRRVSISIPVGSSALFAYHAAGTDEIGLYLLTRTPDEGVPGENSAKSAALAPSAPGNYSVQTICRDRYHRANTGRLLEYTTYFEKISSTHASKTCSALMRQMNIR